MTAKKQIIKRLMKRKQKSKMLSPCSANKFASSFGEGQNGINGISERNRLLHMGFSPTRDPANLNVTTQSRANTDSLKRELPRKSASDAEEQRKRQKLRQAPAPTPVNGSGRRVNFILDNAAIKEIPVKKKWKVARSLDDSEVISRQKKAVDDYRSDIVHEALRAILDSPLNKYGHVGAIFVKVEDGILFEVKPEVRIPRTLERFCGLMKSLLEKSRIYNQETQKVLLRVIEDPVTRYLAANCPVIGLSHSSKKLVNIEDYVSAANDDMDITFVVGTSAKGEISGQYVDDLIKVTNYPLSAKAQAGMICHALEQKWNLF